MAAGVDLSRYENYVVECMVDAQLKGDLAEYYKIMALCLASAGKPKEAMEVASKFADILLPERGDVAGSKHKKLMSELETLDNWKLKIDLSHMSRTDIIGTRPGI